MMLMLSVFALLVGAAANNIFSKAIIYCGRLGRTAWYRTSAGVCGTSVSGLD